MARWSIPDEAPYSFEQFIEFFKEISTHNCFRPIPPMLGNGQPVDLKSLFLIVIGKGGYDAVSKNNLWNLEAERSGLGVNIGSSAKLIYYKYLGTLETWLIKFSEGRVLGYSLCDGGINFGRQLMELQAKIKRLLSAYIVLDGVKSKVQEDGFLGLDMPRNLCNIDDTMTLKEYEGRMIIAKKLVNALDVGDSSNNNEVKNVASSANGGKRFANDDVLILDPPNVNKENFGRKRKRKSMQEMLCWVTSIAKNPCDPIVCSILERSKWSSQTFEEIKKQVLLFREAVFMKRNVEASKRHDDSQGMKLHPRMYDDDHPGTKERSNSGNRSFPNKKSVSVVPVSSKVVPVGTELGDSKNAPQAPQIEDLAEKTALSSALDKFSKTTVPIGTAHQANVPEWTGMNSESDPKWLGTQIWPLKCANHRLLIEGDSIGKGRNDFCHCQVPGSVECVKFHIAENREKVKLELGVAFYHWNFNMVGEEVSHSWTHEEEKKFKDVVQANLKSPKKCLWDRVFRSFPKKSREDLVSYYFNVFVLRRRRFQNRHSPDNIDSDDDVLESEPLIKPQAMDSVASQNRCKKSKGVSKGKVAKA